MLSSTFHDSGSGANDPDLSVTLTTSTATLRSTDLLYIIHNNGYFSQAVGDTSFLLWHLWSYANTAIADIARNSTPSANITTPIASVAAPSADIVESISDCLRVS